MIEIHLRLELDIVLSISSLTASGPFLLALIKAVTPSGALKVSYETNTTSIFDAYPSSQLAPA